VHKKTLAFAKVVLFRRDDWIRTSDPYVPNVVRYRAALHPETGEYKNKKKLKAIKNVCQSKKRTLE
jgi:hypothetical protein